MFAVPGWSLDSKSIAQEKSIANNDSRPSSEGPSAASRKRKSTRSHSNPAPKVSGSELERLWNLQASAKHEPTPRHGHGDQKPGRNQHAHQRGELRDADVGKAAASERKVQNQEKKNKPVQTPSAWEQPLQKSRERISKETQTNLGNCNAEGRDRTPKEKQTTLSNGHAEDASFPRDKILKTLPPAPPPATKLTPLQAKMRSKLTSARFRHLNETLYTTSSSAAMDLFTSSPDLFAEYHAGFSQQVKDSWPVNPVEKYVAAVKSRGQTQASDQDKRQRPLKDTPLPRRPKTSLCTIADLGCGDAPLSRGCQSIMKSHKLKFQNFDLHAPNTQVTKADISNLPLRDGEVDIAVFCLSLMGTNWINFVEEAWRVLRGDGKGECWVSEVKSRFGRAGRRPKGEAVDNSVGKKRKNQRSSNTNGEADLGPEVFAEDAVEVPDTETDISAFVKVFTRRGYQLREDSVDKSNKMFVSMVFVKSGIPTAGKHKGLKWTGREYQKMDEGKLKRGDAGEVTIQEEAMVLKPCVYKKR